MNDNPIPTPGRSSINLLGVDSPPGIHSVFYITCPSWPEWVFEYHPQVKKVYRINRTKTSQKGDKTYHEAELIGEFIESPNQAKAVVKAWLDGFKEGQISEPRIKIGE